MLAATSRCVQRKLSDMLAATSRLGLTPCDHLNAARINCGKISFMRRGRLL